MAKKRTRLSQGPGTQRGLLGESAPSVRHPRANFSMETEGERGRHRWDDWLTRLFVNATEVRGGGPGTVVERGSSV